MSKLGKALGDSFEKNKIKIMTRTFEFGGHTFKVRVPQVGELESIYNFKKLPDDADVESIYQEMIKDLQFSDDPDVVKTENDIVIQGRSMRQAAITKLELQHRIVEYFKLLIPETDASLDDLEYSDIESEFPLPIQLEFVEKINHTISPDYKETRGK